MNHEFISGSPNSFPARLRTPLRAHVVLVLQVKRWELLRPGEPIDRKLSGARRTTSVDLSTNERSSSFTNGSVEDMSEFGHRTYRSKAFFRQSRAKQSKAKQSKAKQSKAKQSKAKQPIDRNTNQKPSTRRRLLLRVFMPRGAALLCQQQNDGSRSHETHNLELKLRNKLRNNSKLRNKMRTPSKRDE